MFDVGFWEFAVIGVVALVIVGPERLPGLARTMGAYAGKARRMVNDVKADVKRELKENDIADVSELKREISDAAYKVIVSVGAQEVQDSVKKAAEDVASLKDELNVKSKTDTTDSVSSESVSAKKAKPKAKKSATTRATKKTTKKTTSKKSAKKTTARKSTTKKATAKKAAGKKKPAKKPAKNTAKAASEKQATDGGEA